MRNSFFATSKAIANDFIQNVVFIDDKAFDNSDNIGQHDFNAYEVTKAFAAHKKICAVYKPKTAQDIDDLAQLAKKADVTVLDWQIDIPKETPSKDLEEEDDDSEDPRGIHTLKIIRDILSDPIVGKGNLKIIIIYTGEPDLDGIADKIHTNVESAGIATLKKDFCEICTDNVKILVIAKADQTLVAEGRQHEQFQQVPDLKPRIVSYEQLPDYIIDRFTKVTTGLLSNFALKALTIIRENTFRFISLYNKDLDNAFLAHRLLLPDQDDSKELLVELFAHSIHSLLTYNAVSETVGTEEVLSWIDTKTFNFQIPILEKILSIDNNSIKSWITDGFAKMCSDLWAANGYGSISGKQKKGFEEKLNTLPAYFITGDRDDKFDKQFSILTHHKSIFKPSPLPPKLTLGAIIKGTKTGKYWVCIQQRCDSVRLKGMRKFLFLPLEPIASTSNDTFHFVTEDGVRLKLQKKSYALRTIKFFVEDGETLIKANKDGERFFFEPYYKDGRRDYEAANDELYEWILDLKDLHAQRIVSEFTSQLSRVGLDEAEWLRRGYTR